MYRQNFPDDPGMHNTRPSPESHNARYPDSNRHRMDRPSFAQTIKRYLLAVVVGFVLICVGVAVIFWNEGRAVQMSRSLDEGLSLVRRLGSSLAVFEENNNKLIHVTGELKTFKFLLDADYGVSISCVKLKRTVDMYQWVEIEHKREIQEIERVRTEVSYSYTQDWKPDLIDSNSFYNRFEHANPESIPVESTTQTAEQVQVGSLYLSRALIDKVDNYRQFLATNLPNKSGIHLHSGKFYHGYDPDNPKIGDLRVTFEYAGRSSSLSSPENIQPDVVSVIGKQEKNHITSFQTLNGGSLELLYMGELSAEAIFGRERASNAILTWALRFAGWLLMFIGFGCWASLITTLVDWIPVVRDLVNLGSHMMSASLAISLSLTIIAFSWLWFRPLLGGTVLFLAVLPFIVARIREYYQMRSRTYNRRSW